MLKDRSVWERLVDETVTDNISFWTLIKEPVEYDGKTYEVYIPPYELYRLETGKEFIAAISVKNIGHFIDFTESTLVVKCPFSGPIELKRGSCEGNTVSPLQEEESMCLYIPIGTLQSNDGLPDVIHEKWCTVIFVPKERVEETEKITLFTYGFYTQPRPIGQVWSGSYLEDFERSQVRITWESVSIGEVKVGKTSSSKLRIENFTGLGSVDLTILNARLKGSDFFRISPTCSYTYPMVIRPGESISLEIEFKPEREGSFRTFLILETDCPTQPLVIKKISAKGVRLLRPKKKSGGTPKPR